MSKNKYLHNNWAKIKDVPDEYFEELPFEQFYDWRVVAWELPSSIDCVIREENIETGKITEYAYSKQSAAKKRVAKIMAKAESTFLLVTQDSFHHMYPKEVGEPYEEDEYDAGEILD